MNEKKVKRKISKAKYAIIALNTTIIFIAGIFFGQQLNQARINMLYNQLSQQNLEYNNLITEYEYINHLIDTKSFDNLSCQVITGAYYTSILHLDDARQKLESYLKSSRVNKKDYQILRERYSDVQLNYWMLGDNIKRTCNRSDFVTILYFFGDKKECPECEDQGTYLTYIKEKYGDKTLIFSIDADEDGPIRLLKNRYGVNNKTLPTVVIGDKKYGFITSDKVESILCKDYDICSPNK
ncbi:MAG: hypothetical protein GWP09_01980 [Nitrospiraceae bacterium]|nr:hypothetical protein [Nitrospiraceae bacterium]